MSSGKPQRPWTLVVLASLAGALVAAVLGFLTSGVGATVSPHGVPVAVAVPDSGPPQSRAVAERVSGQGGEALSWRITTPAEGRILLEDKEIYGVLELTASGPTVVVSGAVNPVGTQVAQQALTAAGQAVTAAQATPAQVKVETLHPAGAAGRTAPLAVTTLAWIGGLVAGMVLMLLAERAAAKPGVGARLLQVAGTAVLVTAVVAGLLKLWDSSLPLGWNVLGFMLLTSAGFAALQAALLRLMGLRAMAVLGPLYLLAPSVASQVPELLNPAYRTLLWSWSPFRFSTEGARSLLQGTPGAPDVTSAVWVLGGLLVVGLVVLLLPGRSTRQEAEANTPDRVVQVGVH